MSAFSYPLTQLALANLISEDERRHLMRIQNAWKRYQGDWPDPLRAPSGRAVDYNLKVNFAREFVDKSVNYLFGQDVGFELDTETRERTEDEAYLDAVWQANRKGSWLQKYAMNGCVAGHAFVLIEPDRLPHPDYGAVPRFINLEPESVWPSWDDLDIDDVWRYRVQFNGIDRESGKPVVRRKLIDRQDNGQWLISDWVAFAGDPQFRKVAEAAWEYEFAPIVHNQNLPAPNEFWGVPDLTDDRLDFMHGINRLISNVNKIVFFDAHKRLYAQGLSGNEDALKEWNIGQILGLPPEARIEAVDTSADIAQVLEFIREMKSWLHENANVPEVAVGKVDGIGQLSGVALEILYQPLTEMIETKRRTYGDALNDLNRRVLALAGREVQDTTLVWPDILPVDEKALAETAQLWHGMGVSADTLMERGGFDPARERERREANDAEFGARLLDRQMAGGDMVPIDE